MVHETRVLTCAFCGEAYPPGTPESNDDALTAHVMVCAKHPMRGAEALASEWQRACGAASPAQAFAERQGRPWQCSGCRHICRAWSCPRACYSCKREGYYSGSVRREDIAAHDAKAWQDANAAGVEP